jgi:arylsulfatase A-like enzyme
MAKSPGAGRRPNVLLLMADQQKATSLPLYGNPDVRTPALDALAARELSPLSAIE